MKNKTFSLILFVFIIFVNSCRNNPEIDPFTLVSRNNIENSIIDSLSSMSVGNRHFIFTVDITGLQTFPDFYSGVNPLITMSDWGLHRGNNPGSYSYSYHLGMMGLKILKENGKEISIRDIEAPVQKLNLWTGEIDSRFNIENITVHLMTVCHPDYDMISVKIISDLIRKKRLSIKINFSPGVTSPTGHDFGSSLMNTTKVLSDTNNLVIFDRSQNNNDYNVMVWCNDADLNKIAQHLYSLEPDRSDSIYSFSCQFLNNPETGRIQNFGETEAASRKSWGKFWTTGSTIDFKRFTGPQSRELERNIIRSTYFNKLHFFYNTK